MFYRSELISIKEDRNAITQSIDLVFLQSKGATKSAAAVALLFPIIAFSIFLAKYAQKFH